MAHRITITISWFLCCSPITAPDGFTGGDKLSPKVSSNQVPTVFTQSVSCICVYMQTATSYLAKLDVKDGDADIVKVI